VVQGDLAVTAAYPEPADWLWRVATRRNVVIAFAAFVLVSAAFAAWAHLAHVKLGDEVGRFGFRSPDAIERHLSSLGERAKRYALQSTRTLDLVFPVVYSVALSLAIAALLRHLHAPQWQLARFLPFAGAAADYAENVFILLWASGRTTARKAARPLAVFTAAKWGLVLLSLAVVVVLLVALGAARLRS
jgi:hypothetical protein